MTVEQRFCWNYSILHRFWDKCIFALYTENRDCRKKCGKTIFLQKVADDCIYPLGRKFCEIARSCTVSEINALLCRNSIFLAKRARWLSIPWGPNISSKSLYLTPFQRQMPFCVLHRNSFAKHGVKTIFCKKCQNTLHIPWGSKILSKSLYLALFQTTDKNASKMIFGKSARWLCIYPSGKKYH